MNIAQGTHTGCIREYGETQPKLNGAGELFVTELCRFVESSVVEAPEAWGRRSDSTEIN